jgi:hypothetical protein
MLTAYDMYSAEIFDEAGIPVLLVGDSAANNVYGHDNTLPVTVDELLPLVKAVVKAAKSALVVADLPFGSYQIGPEQALTTAFRFMKEGGAHAVKLEGGARFVPQVEALAGSGIPVMAHLGFTPQSEHALGGYRVQGRGDDAAEKLLADARAVTEAGAFEAIVETMGHERLLYGSDFYISHLRGRCVAVGDSFHWFYAEDMNLEERHTTLRPVLVGIEALRSLRLAARRLKLTDRQVEDIFYNNAAQLFPC